MENNIESHISNVDVYKRQASDPGGSHALFGQGLMPENFDVQAQVLQYLIFLIVPFVAKSHIISGVLWHILKKVFRTADRERDVYKRQELYGEEPITDEHVQNNSSVREMLGQRGIKPEDVPPAEDLKKLERRVKRDEKKLMEG